MPTIHKYTVESFGFKLVEKKFRLMAKDAAMPKPAFSKIADYLMQITDKQFSSQGRRGGGSWARLTPKWQTAKARKGKDPRILIADNVLRRSVTKRRARGQVLIITPNSLTFGSNLEYAATHQFGDSSRGIPKRPFIRVTRGDIEAMGQIMQDHLIRSFKKGGELRATRQR